jgi:DNA-binding transcriptional regulator YdaS (Cro superfamily)
MKLADYLKLRNIKANVWSAEVGLPKATIYAFLAGKRKLMLSTALAISKATGGAVTLEDLNIGCPARDGRHCAAGPDGD